jgi:hypothetical protein
MESRREIDRLQRENEELKTKLHLQRDLLQVFSNYELSLGQAPQPLQPVVHPIREEKIQYVHLNRSIVILRYQNYYVIIYVLIRGNCRFDPANFVSFSDHKKVVQELEYLKKVVHVSIKI